MKFDKHYKLNNNNIKQNSKKLRVFETFAGIGAQHKALQYIKENYGYDYKVVATSEWDIFANISYSAIHNNSDINNIKTVAKGKNIERERERDCDFLSWKVWSFKRWKNTHFVKNIIKIRWFNTF